MENVPQAASGVLDLSHWDFQESGKIPMEGEWRFLWKELRSPGEMAGAGEGSFVFVPEKWNHYDLDGESPEMRGYGTFALTLLLPGDDAYYGLSFDGVGSAYSLWLDGDLLMECGTVGTSRDQMVPEKVPRLSYFKSSGEPVELVIHISNYHHKKGGFRNSLFIGTPGQIQSFQRKAWTLDAFTQGILLIMGLYHVSVFIFRKKNRSALYFALLCFSFLLRLGVTNQDLFLLTFPFLSWTAAFYLDYIPLFFIPPLVALFYKSLFPRDIPRRFILILCFFGVAFSLFSILGGTYFASFSTKYFQFLIFFEIAYYLYFLVRINIKKREGALVITIASLILFVASSIEILSLWDWVASEKIGVYGFLSFILVQSILLARRYSHAFVRVESLTGELKSTNKVLKESEARYRHFFENSIDILFLADGEGRIIDVSPSCAAILGYGREDVHNRKAAELFGTNMGDAFFGEIRKSGKPVNNIETVLKHRDGGEVAVLITLSLRSDENGNPAGFQGSIHDNTDKKRAEQEKMRALTDSLTKAYNRRFFDEIARKESERALRNGSPFSLVMLDIDFFKKINDRYGHLKGDDVLINLTRLIHGHIRSTDILARFGGEEFVIYFPDAEGREAEKRAEALREKVSSTVLAREDGEEIRVTISMGVSCWTPGQDLDLTELLDRADKAMYKAKKSGRNRVVTANL